ncbi:hypothetical protein LY76DRAFT_605933 [Colletotrichum caudatum]|nr:hypothetical protein LY76DRAFT_605933 [Colletotrichum caudatum]
MLATIALALATLVSAAAADVAIFLPARTWADTCYLDDLVPVVGATYTSITIGGGPGSLDEKYAATPARFDGTDPAIYQHGVEESTALKICDTDVIARTESTSYGGESAALSIRAPSANRTSEGSRQTADWPQATIYGTQTAATQSSAGRKSAQPPAIKPTGGYAGVVVMTVLTCVVAFGIGSILGWIWPDGPRSER